MKQFRFILIFQNQILITLLLYLVMVQNYYTQGDGLINIKQFELALEQYRKIKKLKKDLIIAYLKIGLTLGQMGQIKQALKYFIKTQNEIMEDPKLEWTRCKLVRLLFYRQGDNIFYQLLNNRNQQIIETMNSNPNNDLLLCLEADILFATFKFDEAEQTLKKTIKINPNRSYTWVKLSKLNYYNCYINYFKDILNEFFNLIIQGKYQEALSQLDNIILKAFPHNLDCISYKSDILRVLKQFQESIVGYNQCISYNQNYIEAYTKKAYALRNLEQYQEALEIYNLLLQNDPKNYEILFEKGCTMFEMREYDTANQLFDQVLVLSSNNLNALTKQGDILLVLGLFEDSLEIYEKILSIQPNHFFALWGKSESLRGLRKFSESLIWYDKVLEQNSIYPYAYHYKGYALQQLDRHEEAINNFLIALSIIPGLKLSEEAFHISKQKLKVQK